MEILPPGGVYLIALSKDIKDQPFELVLIGKDLHRMRTVELQYDVFLDSQDLDGFHRVFHNALRSRDCRLKRGGFSIKTRQGQKIFHNTYKAIDFLKAAVQGCFIFLGRTDFFQCDFQFPF